MARRFETRMPPPWLKRIWIKDELVKNRGKYPFHIPLFRSEGFELNFTNDITIIVGDNGSGKSTLLEAIATLAGFGRHGGGRDHQILIQEPWEEESGTTLASCMGASWLPRIPGGWFFRAESFFSLAHYMERAAFEAGEQGPGFLHFSHGEGFMRAFSERCNRQGLFVFDEPESALSPQRQFEFIKFVAQQRAAGKIQAVVATHSPILMAIPDAQILQLDQQGLLEVDLRDTPHFRLFREFCADPAGTIEVMTQA